jgi:NAD+ kinase
MTMFHTVGILSKLDPSFVDAVVPPLRAWLSARKLCVLVEQATAACAGLSEPGVTAEEFAREVDLAIVLGGDGTLLSAARLLHARQVPILGVNLGSLGFLASVGLEELYVQVESILRQEYDTSARMMLEATVLRGDHAFHNGFALNEAVVNQAARARLMDFNVFVDGSHIGRYRADGLIVATPTGSTAYSLAAGGPIVHPDLQAFLITPICPHMLTHRPIVIPDTSRVEIESSPGAEPLRLTLDGQMEFSLERGDLVSIRKSASGVLLISPKDRSYYDVLRGKLGWVGG